MNFDQAFERLIGHEGNYSNHPADPGGETMFGITKNVAIANGYTGPMQQLTLDRAKLIAKSQYWDKVSADSFIGAVGFQLFDISYNHGVGAAVKMLQRAVGIPADGFIGPVTVARVAALPPLSIVCLLNAQRISFYTSLPTWSTFGKGWANRVAGNLAYGVSDV